MWRRSVTYAPTVSLWTWPKFSMSLSVPMEGLMACRLQPPMLTLLQTATDESPCSPIMTPCTDWGSTPNLWARKKRNLAESRVVPLPNTRLRGNPLSFQVTYVIISTGFDTTSNTASGLYFARLGIRSEIGRHVSSQMLHRWNNFKYVVVERSYLCKYQCFSELDLDVTLQAVAEHQQ